MNNLVRRPLRQIEGEIEMSYSWHAYPEEIPEPRGVNENRSKDCLLHILVPDHGNLESCWAIGFYIFSGKEWQIESCDSEHVIVAHWSVLPPKFPINPLW